MYKKEILITGGKGYIGSNLVDYLEEKDCGYTIIDKKDDNWVLDINDVWRYDAVVHLAAEAGVCECRDDPETAIITNVESTSYIMNEAKKYEVPLVFASSGAAPTPYESLYGMTKFIGECIAKRLNLYKGKNHILRFANVYGGKYWEEKPSVIPLFINAKAKGEKLVVNGNGSQTRDFIHVNDICRAIWLALNSDRVTNQPIPIGSGRLTSILEIATMIGGNNSFTFYPDSDKIGVQEVSVDTKLAEDIYDFKAKENIEYHLDND